jgi:adenosylcobinamide-phosphate synthase
MNIAAAALAVVIERYAGYPPALQNVLGHPVQWIGALITWLDQKLNSNPEEAIEGKLRGGAALLLLLTATALPAWMLVDILSRFSWGWIAEALIATTLIAQKSLHDHVKDVATAMSSSLTDARKSVAKIVGRDTATLDESGVSKAALESLAENTADGIVAPVFWFAVLGLPGLVAYKAINTADSMIGHKSKRYLHFGFASAKFDDLVNLPASRLTALFFAAAALFTNTVSAKRSFISAWRDAGKHRSPNAGWPEAAMAGALGVRFGGPRNYEGEFVDLPYMGDGRDLLTRTDIQAGLALYDRSLWLILTALVALALIL